ncbi:Cation_diffusion facilitator family transport protein [Hexamita inflata]|uniref:Cation diffusion facilitator family transport protein n=1 Tax=Hexamita inflata TaxID=28002 RepID=A0AA86R7G3_9EUKA|nr:Cation diffusion facilitator family transport protein [Hexamita inflata]
MQKSCAVSKSSNTLITHEKVSHKETRVSRMIIMIVMVVSYMFAELLVGIIGNSLTLLGDSFHMISDAMSLVIGLVTIKLSQRKADKNYSFGFKIGEVLGAFFNASFLISTAFFLLTEIVSKFMNPEEIKNVDLVLWVAVGGVVINIIGLFMFGHSHDGHDHHDHGDSQVKTVKHKHAHMEKVNHSEVHEHEQLISGKKKRAKKAAKPKKQMTLMQEMAVYDQVLQNEHDEVHPTQQQPKKQRDMAMHGVWIHVLGDFIGSIVVIASTLVQKFLPKWNGRLYIDPACSLVMCAILVHSSLPLLKESMKVLMMTSNVDTEYLKKQILQVKGVAGVHDLHVWTFTQGKEVAHCHVVVRKSKAICAENHRRIQSEVARAFHDLGVHNVTVNIEYVGLEEKDVFACFSQNVCSEQNAWCCELQPKKVQA